ncbi:MAG: ribosomal protein S18-alanine N-acetyltransferase [candidate division WOR-3 bacterium]|nr:MAG: ribosomal protein S18-alanine N-acetyltransferase [candidate division WOR-3 bacterium]
MPKETMIRVMRLEDLDAVVEIEKRSFPNPWPRFFFEKDLESGNTVAFVAENDCRLVGYVLGSCIDVELHITNIAVAEDRQRHGLATRMLHEMEGVARTRGCGFAYLEVRTTNDAAVSMYRKNGYDILYTRKRYYIDGNDAYVMHKELR